jgi:hypothetical protein
MWFLEPEGRAQKSHSHRQNPSNRRKCEYTTLSEVGRTNVKAKKIDSNTALGYLVYTMDVREYIVEIIWHVDGDEST